jgi:hypothetical protein
MKQQKKMTPNCPAVLSFLGYEPGGDAGVNTDIETLLNQ